MPQPRTRTINAPSWTDAQEESVKRLRLLLEDTMREQGVSQHELARRLGVSSTNVNFLLRGRSANMSVYRVVEAFAALGKRLTFDLRNG